MKLKLTLFSFFTLFCLITNNLLAQTASPVLSASHMKAAENYLIATNIDTQFPGIVDNIIKASSAQIPVAQQPEFIKTMKAFMDKYYSWGTLKDSYIKMYAAEFSEDELNKLAAFYNTPLGKKLGSKTPVLLQKGMMIGQEVVAGHRAELEQMMKDAFQKQEAPAKQ